MWFKISQRYYFLLNLYLVRKCITYLVLLLMTVTLRAQDVSVRDVELSRYEVLCEGCLDLKARIAAGEKISRKYAQDIIDSFISMNADLKERQEYMTASQLRRFNAVGVWFTTGEKPDLNESELSRFTALNMSTCAVSLCEPITMLDKMETSVKKFRRWDYLNKCILTDYSTYDQAFGCMLGLHGPRYGGYVRARFRHAISGVPGDSYQCLSDGSLPDGMGKFWGTGKSEIYTCSYAAGTLVPATKWLTFYAGAGYAETYTVWQDIDHEWALVADRSVRGFVADLGIVCSYGRIAVSAGASTTRFRAYSFTCGVGVRL